MADEELNNQTEELAEKCEQYLNGWKRSLADYENLKKETEKKLAASCQNAKNGFIKRILPILDHYNLAIIHLPKEQENEDWAKGFKHIHDEFALMLNELNIEKIATAGAEFDPRFHEALSYEDSDEPDNTVIKELKSGYLIDDEVIQPAQVVVARNQKNQKKDN